MLFSLPAAQVLAENIKCYGSRNFDLPNVSVVFPIFYGINMVVSHAAKENATTVRIYTHNNGACIHPY